MNHGRFEEFRAKESDPTQFKILGLSPQLPDDVLIAGSHVEASTIDQLRSAFATQSDALVAALLKGTRNNKYDGMRFTTNVDDSDYDLVRQMYANAGHEHLIEERG